METMRELLAIVVSWPTAIIISVLVLRAPIKMLIQRLVHSEIGRAKVGPIEVELGKLAEQGREAVESLDRLNLLMAESRLLELEITQGKFGSALTPDQRARMERQIEELRGLTDSAANKGFNRTPESSGPAKPGESGGGAG